MMLPQNGSLGGPVSCPLDSFAVPLLRLVAGLDWSHKLHWFCAAQSYWSSASLSFPVSPGRLHSPVHMPRNCLSFLVRKSIGMPWPLGKSFLASLCLLELLWLDPLENGNSFPLMAVNRTSKPGLHLCVRQGRPPREQPAHPRGLCKQRAGLLSIFWQQEGCICLPLANEYANYRFLLPLSGVIFSLSLLHVPHDLYLICVDYPVAREVNSKRFSGPFSFPRNSFFCLKILLAWEKRNQPFPAVWNTDLQNIQKSGGDGFCVFAQNDIKIDLWWVQPFALPALSLGGVWIGEMRWLFVPTGYREPGETLSVSAFRWLKSDEVNSVLGVMQNTLNYLAGHTHTGFCAQFLNSSGDLWRPDLHRTSICCNFAGWFSWFSFRFLKLKA